MPGKQDQVDQPDIRATVRQHYGKAAQKFKPGENRSSCCSPRPESERGCCSPTEGNLDSTAFSPVKFYETPAVEALPEDVTGLSMGCGDPVSLAALQPGETVLDLGSGGGIDCFLAARSVGETGYVIGVDMTAEMLEKARANKARLGVRNVDFRLGEIEHLPVADNTVDVIISNCVINLSPDKPQVFREAYRVLKPGGRIAVSDIVTAGPLPRELRENLDAWAECVAGALPVEEYIAAMKAAGFVDITVTPVYFDQAMMDEALQQVTPEAAKTDVRQLIFSAKVTARKI